MVHATDYKNAKCAKTPFDNKKAALLEIKTQHSQHIHFSKKYTHRKNNLKVRPYECPRCGKWHLTTQKQKRKY